MSQPEVRARVELLRVLGLAFGLAVVVGAVVGQGIMRTPGIVAGVFPDRTLILTFWLAGGALVAVSAFALVELATSIPRAGGPYTFAGRAFGPFPGYLCGPRRGTTPTSQSLSIRMPNALAHYLTWRGDRTKQRINQWRLG